MQSKKRIEKLKEVRNLLSGKREPKMWVIMLLNGKQKSTPPGYEDRHPDDNIIKINIVDPDEKPD